jgi:diguanylate cyclase (GGDEF)-like protein
MYSLCIIIKNHKKIIKEENTPLILFSIFSIIGGIVQTLFYGVLLMWSSAAFSFIIVYIFLQKRMIQLDKLTGAWTRVSFGQYVLQRANHVNNWGDFGVIFIDLDGLKNIYDTYGHLEGDHAIKTAVKLIRNSLRKTDIIARFGGDEFVVVLDSITIEEINNIINEINEQFEAYNTTSGKEYKIEYSYGADIFNSNYRNIDHFLNHVDNLMYIRKGDKKKD